MNTIQSFFYAGFLTDLRSLAVFRICLGLTLILDLTLRLFDLNSFYTSEGVLPSLPQNLLVFSFHVLNGSIYLQLALFILTIIAAIFLVLGFHTKLAAR